MYRRLQPEDEDSRGSALASMCRSDWGEDLRKPWEKKDNRAVHTRAEHRQGCGAPIHACYVRIMSSRSLNERNGVGRRRATTPKRRSKARATTAQQAARGRFLSELAKKGAAPSEDEVQAILRELEGE